MFSFISRRHQIVLYAAVIAVTVVSCNGKSIIAVYDKESTSNCFNGSDIHSVDEMPSHFSDNTEVRLCSSQIRLKTVVNISNASNITMVGYDYPTVFCSDDLHGGFYFRGIRNLTHQTLKSNSVAI